MRECMGFHYILLTMLHNDRPVDEHVHACVYQLCSFTFSFTHRLFHMTLSNMAARLARKYVRYNLQLCSGFEEERHVFSECVEHVRTKLGGTRQILHQQ